MNSVSKFPTIRPEAGFGARANEGFVTYTLKPVSIDAILNSPACVSIWNDIVRMYVERERRFAGSTSVAPQYRLTMRVRRTPDRDRTLNDLVKL